MTDSIETSEDEALPWVPPVAAEDVHAMTYKLPPLPEWFESASENLKNDVRNYAIEAIEAQGVPDDADVWCEYVAEMVGAYISEPVGSEKVKAIAGIIRRRMPQRFFASTPPAPQAEQRLTGWIAPTNADHFTFPGIPDPTTFGGQPQAAMVQQEPAGSTMTAQRAAYFMERFKHEEKLLGPNEQAAVDFVLAMLEMPQQEPVMIYHGDCTIDCGEHGHHNVEMLKMIPAGSLLYTHPAQQAKQPLSDERIRRGFAACGVGGINARIAFSAGVKFAEAAHGIKGEQA